MGYRITATGLMPRNNDFTLVRLILATAVIWTHSVWSVTGREGVDEFVSLVGTPVSVLAVNGFFFVSGFLVCASALRQDGPASFAAARLTRLWPGLAVSVLLTVLVGFVFSADRSSFLTGGDTLRYVAFNLSLLKGWYSLSTYSCGGSPCIVNGSLWTIPWEVRCYAAIGLVYLLPRARRAHALALLCAASLVAILAWFLFGHPERAQAGLAYNLRVAARLWGIFALGALCFLWRDRLRLDRRIAVALLAGAVAQWQLWQQGSLLILAWPYALLCMIFTAGDPPSRSGAWPDYSYGIYIYAFPVMLGIAALVDPGDHAVLALLTLGATLPLAAASWHWIEKPALDWLRAARRRRRDLAAMPARDALRS